MASGLSHVEDSIEKIERGMTADPISVSAGFFWRRRTHDE